MLGDKSGRRLNEGVALLPIYNALPSKWSRERDSRRCEKSEKETEKAREGAQITVKASRVLSAKIELWRAENS